MALQESYNTGDSNDVSCYSGTNIFGQTWLTTSAYTIGSVKLKLQRAGLGNNITVEIWATTAGKPSGVALASGTFDTSIVTTTPGGDWYEISLTPYALSDATVYAIVMSSSDGNVSNHVLWRYQTIGAYADGVFWKSADSGVSWSEVNVNSGDAMFETYDYAVTYVDIAGALPGSSALVGDFSTLGFVDIVGALAGTGTLAALITPLTLVLNTQSGKTRLVAAGDNQIWYEDV